MSTRICICVDLDTNEPIEAYASLYETMSKTGLEWESSDEWFLDDGSLMTAEDAQAARMAVFKQREENPPVYFACPECGCTDVQETAWVEINSGKVMDDEGPTEQAFCPQCEAGGFANEMRTRDLEETTTVKPYEE